MYKNNDHKLAVVLNSKIALPRLFNAAVHCVAGLVARLEPTALQFEPYFNADEKWEASISRFPNIILKARNGSQLSKLRADASAAGVPINHFVSTMVGMSAEQQLELTRVAKSVDLEFWAVAVFGDAEEVGALTRKFSLFNVGGDDVA